MFKPILFPQIIQLLKIRQPVFRKITREEQLRRTDTWGNRAKRRNDVHRRTKKRQLERYMRGGQNRGIEMRN